MGLIPAGAYRNRDFAGEHIQFQKTDMVMEDLVFDPQTSGGLLLAISSRDRDEVLKVMDALTLSSAIIGEVLDEEEKSLIFE
ncbi:MAG: AIR synthase-related protein, partial [Blautia sp.]|nr:AIR synthase-related protein [Blautia sp.]